MTLGEERNMLGFLILQLIVEAFSHLRKLLQFLRDLEAIRWAHFLLDSTL